MSWADWVPFLRGTDGLTGRQRRRFARAYWTHVEGEGLPRSMVIDPPHIDFEDHPRRPQGVRIRHPDGTCTPIELRDDGATEDGIREWAVLTPLSRGDKVEVDVFPGRTSLVFKSTTEDE